MPRRNRFKRPEGIHEPNMVPLIDVSLVLVVILLVATPMAWQSGIAVSRTASSGQKAEPARTERIEVNILAADSILVNRLLVSRPTLGFRLRTLLQTSATRQVVVRCAHLWWPRAANMYTSCSEDVYRVCAQDQLAKTGPSPPWRTCSTSFRARG